MKIGILSDSHTKSTLHDAALSHLLERGAQYLLHAGDIHSREHIEKLSDTGLPYRIVFGNNDHHLSPLSGEFHIYKEPYYLKIKELRIKMMHLPFYMTPDTDVVIFGHTHRFECAMRGDTLFLNPGEVCAREKERSECVLLSVDGERYTVEHFTRHPNGGAWEREEFTFSRRG